MYRADNFSGNPPVKLRGPYHHLAECMRRGCKVRPRKIRGYFRRGPDMANAVGAAAEGCENRRPPAKLGGCWLLDVFPVLRQRWCIR